jgi:threonine/homoserine/homoserine lactone efflux protein
MILILILKGLLIGYLGSMPLGPINILIIQRTITIGRRAGFFSGIGAALSDTTYVTVAAFSLSVITGFIRQNELFFKIFAAVILSLLGLYIFFSNPHPRKSGFENSRKKLVNLVFSTYLLTITNPFPLFAYIGVFASTGLLKNINPAWHTVFLIAGFLLGACGWWFTQTGIIKMLHGRFNFKSFRVFNKITGAIILLLVLGSIMIYLFIPAKQI